MQYLDLCLSVFIFHNGLSKVSLVLEMMMKTLIKTILLIQNF